MAGVILYLSVYSWAEHNSKVNCQLQAKVNSEIARQERDLYDSRIASYDSAILDITQFYDFELKNIDDFKKDDNETECDASYRILREFKY